MEKSAVNRMVLRWLAFGIFFFLILYDSQGLLQSLKGLNDVISPLIIGFVLALIWNVPMTKLEGGLLAKWCKNRSGKCRRLLALFLTLLLFAGILAGVLMLVIPKLVETASLITECFGQQTEQTVLEPLRKMAEQCSLGWIFDRMIPKFFDVESTLSSQMARMVPQAVEEVKGAAGGVLDVGFGLVFAIYILIGKEKWKAQLGYLLSVWLPYGKAERISHGLFLCFRAFRGFVVGQMIEAFLLGILCGAGMFLLRLPYAGTIGVLVGVTALIPIVGAFAGAAVGAFLLLMVSPKKVLIFLAFLLLLQQIEGNIIYPKVVGAKIQIPPMWVLASVVVGGNLAGPFGMFLGVPIFSAMYSLIKEETKRRELQKAAGEIP